METKRSCQLTAPLCLLVNLQFEKKIVINQNLIKKIVVIVLKYTTATVFYKNMSTLTIKANQV